MAKKQNKSTFDLLFHNQMLKRKQEVIERRHVVKIVVDVLKVIGKQGLAFRASTEQAYTIFDHSINHGNFLELILLLGKYDLILKKHLDAIVTKSEQLHEAREHMKNTTKNTIAGRGTFVTFFSNTTITKIIQIIVKEIKRIISADIKEAVKYSILMDTTIDISGNDQCAFVVRYVKEREVFERLLSLKCVTSTTAEGLFATLSNILEEAEIPIQDCVANAFDGASNMSGPYNGLTAKLSNIIPNHIHTWCYAHVLNLVLSDTAQILPITISFFSLLQDTQVFLKESLKRQQKYAEESPAYKLEAIGATRWRSRSNATVKIFGRIDSWLTRSDQSECEPPKHVFFELIMALYKISSTTEFNSKVRDNAMALLRKFLSFEIIMTAMIFLQIFKITTPLSDYIQTKNLDYAQAWRLIESALLRLKTIRDKFEETFDAAKNFIMKFRNKIERSSDKKFLKNLTIETDFKMKRHRKIKKMADELCNDEKAISSPEEEFRIHTYNCIIDTIVQTMENRFVSHKTLYLDISVFDPRRFNLIKCQDLPTNALVKICELIPSLNREKLKEEIISFANVWTSVCRKSLSEDYKETDATKIMEHDEFENSADFVYAPCEVKNPCNACIKCAFGIITEYNMYSLQYTELYRVYKYLLTIPLTQVSCERVFSKLRLIKTRLRSSMTDDTTEALVLMHSEKSILNVVEPDFVIDKLCETSSEMRRLLIP